MFYTITKEGMCRTPLENIQPEETIVGYITAEELPKYDKQLGIPRELIDDCVQEHTHFRMGLEVYDAFSFAMLHIIDLQDVKKGRDKVAFFMRNHFFVFVEIEDRDGHVKELFERAMEKAKQNLTLERVIFIIFEYFLENGNRVLDKMEQDIFAMEREIVSGKIDKNLNKKIFEMKRHLTIQKNYYEQLISVVDDMDEDENHLFEQDEFKYFKIFMDKAGRLSGSTKLLCEDLVHVREALDAGLDYNLNSIMKLFTVVTTIFMPLTLIVGWYGMNFDNMPELAWEYGYLLVVVVSILVVIFCIIFFKKKKLL
ncbi:hypothetical protein LQZ18_01045 [Lachnospiraceae bacterium ZAX-1]